MGVPSTYDRRPGDVVRYMGAGRDVTSIFVPPWRSTHADLKRVAQWPAVGTREEMTIVGRVPYPCSYDWVLFRHNAPEEEAERWIMIRDSSMTVLRTSWQACLGQTAIMRSIRTGSEAEVGVIVAKHKGGMQMVHLALGGQVLSHVGFHELEIMIPTPDGYNSHRK